MTLKQLGLEKSEWRKLLDVPANKLLDVQVELGKQPGGPLTMSGGRKGIGGGGRPGGFGPVVDGSVLPHHPFDPEAPAISKNKPLIVGSNRDETAFFLMERHDTDAFNLSNAGLEARLQKELGEDANTVLDTYRKSRPGASPGDLYVAVTTARMIGLGAITLAERKYAQHAAPVYMYIFTHGSDFIVPGTQHKVGAAHALEIQYKFNNIQPAAKESTTGLPSTGTMMSQSEPNSDPDPCRTAMLLFALGSRAFNFPVRMTSNGVFQNYMELFRAIGITVVDVERVRWTTHHPGGVRYCPSTYEARYAESQ